MTMMFSIEVFKDIDSDAIFTVSADMTFFNSSIELVKGYVNGETIKLKFYFVEDS